MDEEKKSNAATVGHQRLVLPASRAYSLEEINNKLTEWMLKNYGHPLNIDDDEEKGRWYQYNGMIHHFLSCYFPDSEGNLFEENS